MKTPNNGLVTVKTGALCLVLLTGCTHHPIASRTADDEHRQSSPAISPSKNPEFQNLVAGLLARTKSNISDEVMLAYQQNLEVIAHNLANANTPGYKRIRCNFQEQLTSLLRSESANQHSLSNSVPPEVVGTAKTWPLPSTLRSFVEGDLTKTDERLDLAILGDGFFEVQMPDGTRAYTRDGAFKLASDTRVVTRDGLPLLGGFFPVPANTHSIVIERNGTVLYEDGAGQSTFQIKLCRFRNPGGLQALGQNLYAETASSGQPELCIPGEQGCGEILQSYLEMSNVNVAQELEAFINTYRAYEAYCLVRHAQLKTQPGKGQSQPSRP